MPIGRWSFASLGVWVVLGIGGHALAENAIDAPSCKKAANAIVAQTGAALKRVTQTNDNLLYDAPGGVRITLYCSTYIDPFASVSATGATPSADYYGLVAKTAAILFRASPAASAAAAAKCRSAAIKDAEGRAAATTPAATFECQASNADGGFTAVTVRSRDLE